MYRNITLSSFISSLLLGLLLYAVPVAAAKVQTWTLTDHFGVSHPQQVVTFALDRAIEPGNCYLLNDANQEVPFQRVAGGKFGEIAVSMDLPANAARTFTLMSGRAPQAFPQAVQVDAANPEYYQITNGLTGVRVPKVYAPLTITPKAPIQGVQFRDGAWSPAGTPISFISDNNEGGITSVDAMSVTAKESGPIRAVIEVTYRITSPALSYGPLNIRDAAPAHYTTTFTLEKDQPSILIETDADLFSQYSLSLYAGVQPTQMRYQGHHADSPKNGHLADGSVYPMSHTRPPGDALVDVDYAGVTARMLALWNPWVANSGWYWQMYRADGAAAGNLMGIFAGSPARLIGAGYSGPGIYARPGPDAGISVVTNLRGPDNSRYYFATASHTIRFDWGIFAGTRADVPAQLTDVPTIAKQFCLHGNGVSLNKLAHWQLDYPDPARPFGAMFMSKEAVSDLIKRCRTDDQFYRYIYDTSPYSRDIWDMWRDTSGAKAHAMVTGVHAELGRYIDDWENGFGYLSTKFTTQPWLLPGPKLDRYDQLLGNELVTPEEKTKIKADAAFFANWLWDYDVYPLMVDPTTHGNVACVNMGTANMPGQWFGTRSSYTWYLASHPVIATHLADAMPNWYQINEHGAPNTCPHYTGTITPQFDVEMQRIILGHSDWTTEPRLAKFGEWYLNWVSPADVRFGGKRAMIVDGDSESNELPSLIGLLGTECARDIPTLSRRLMWMWANNGKPQDDFYGSTVLRIDDKLPTEDPQLGNATFPGYGAVLRSAWNTPLETSIHAFTGNWYNDHRHGGTDNLVIFALGAPLALGWESMYNPQAPSPYLHNMVIPEANLGIGWNADFTSLTTAGAPWSWASEAQDFFASFSQSGAVKYHAAAADLTWNRAITSIHPDADYPLVLIKDDFSGKRANDSMTLTLTQMAAGAVVTPTGNVTPTDRLWDINKAQQYPAGGTAYNLTAGLQRFQFTGQQFGTADKPAAAIDWDLYDVVPGNQQFCIGSWGHNNGGRAGGDFRAANGTEYQQRQYLFHLKGAGGFTTLLVPRRKGTTTPVVTLDGADLVVKVNGETTRITDAGYTFTSATRDILTTYVAAPTSAFNLSVEGGPLEVVVDKTAKTITITAHGAKGPRTFILPGAWKAQNAPTSLTMKAGKYTLDYQGDAPLTLIFGKK